MDKIVMVDLHRQYLKIKSEIDSAIQQVINDSAFIKGPDVREFEKELAQYLGAKHVIACGNGTDALQVSLMSCGLQKGDEVITPDFTFVSTVEVVALLGLKPVLVDVDYDTFNMSIPLLEKAITRKTKAIIPVHLFGQCANMGEIMKLARENDIVVIEDAAQALGAVYDDGRGLKAKAGTIGHIGCTSFFPSKNLGCYGDGGAIITNDDNLADKISLIINHGMKIKYHNEILGVNSRLDTIQAAVLRVKLKYLDQYALARQKAALFYDRELRNARGIVLPGRVPYSSHVFHQYTLRLEGIDREIFRNSLWSKGIPTGVYYPLPLHVQKAFEYLNLNMNHFPVSDNLCNQVVSLPMHTELDEEQLDYITQNILEIIRESNG